MIYSEEYKVDLAQIPLRSYQASSAGMYKHIHYSTHCLSYYHQADRELLETPDLCVICFETLDATASYRRLPCAHLLHQPCIDTWLCNRDTSCPLCRQKFYHLRQRRKEPSSYVDSVNAVYMPYPPRHDVSNGRLNSFKSWCKRKLRRHSQLSADTAV